MNLNFNSKTLASPTVQTPATLVAIALTFICASVQAQHQPRVAGGSLGLGIATAPIYQGSDASRESAIPLVEYNWENGLFVGGRGLVGMQFSKHPKLQYGVVLGYDMGRKEGDSRHLRGMGDVASSATVGGFVSYRPSENLSLNSSFRVGSGNDQKGAEKDWGISYAIPLGQGAQVSLNAAVSVANAAYMQSYFGVDSAQALTSHYKRYTPSGGLRDVKASVGLNYPLSPVWIITSGIQYTALSNLASDSPLVRKANSTSAFVGAVRRF